MGTRDIETIGEQALLEQARRGDERAHDRLWRRHGPLAWRFAFVLTGHADEAAEAVAAGWATATANPRQLTSGVSVAAQVLEAVHHAVPGSSAWPPGGEDALGAAFGSLPTRRRAALWLSGVEGAPTTDVAVALGIGVLTVEAVAERASEQMGDAVLAEAATAERPARCQPVVEMLAGYAKGELGPRPAARVRRHLDGCAACEALLTSLDDLTPSLRRLVPAMPAALTDAARFRWSGSLVRLGGPLHLALPSGRAVPPWFERAVAAGAAAVVALGISAAVVFAGRGGKTRDDRLTEQAAIEQPLGAPDGESALGDGPPATLDSGAGLSALDLSPQSLGAPSGSTAPSSPVVALEAPGSRPTAAAPGTAAGDPSGPAPTTPPAAPVPPPVTSPPTTEPALQVSVGVPGVIGVGIGEECTGVEVLGTAIGCDLPEAEGPLDLELGGSLVDGLGLGGLGLGG